MCGVGAWAQLRWALQAGAGRGRSVTPDILEIDTQNVQPDFTGPVSTLRGEQAGLQTQQAQRPASADSCGVG